MRRRSNAIVLTPAYSVAQDFLSVYRKTWDSVLTSDTADAKRVLSLRPSQLPFCPISFFCELAMRGMNRSLDMAGGYYTQVGTTVHTVMQQYLPQSGRFLADYHCRECGTWHRLSHQWECCDFPADYHEIEIKWKGVVGHIDGIFKDRKGRYWILDFKTTSTKGATKKEKDPGPVYTEQVEAYAYFLKLQYGIAVEGVMLVFIVRDNPETPVVWTRPITQNDRLRIKAKFLAYKAMHKFALDIATEAQAVSMIAKFGLCINPHCKYCTTSKTVIKEKIRTAFRRGSPSGHVPIRAMANRKKTNTSTQE